jgi:hypothetical protein
MFEFFVDNEQYENDYFEFRDIIKDAIVESKFGQMHVVQIGIYLFTLGLRALELGGVERNLIIQVVETYFAASEQVSEDDNLTLN